MKVLAISGEYPPAMGGLADYTFLLRQTLVEQGVEVDVLTSTQPSSTENEPAVLRIVDNWQWSSWETIRGVVRDRTPDIVDIQYQSAAYGIHPAINGLPGRLRKSCPGTKVVVTFHDLRPPYAFPKAGRLRNELVRQTAQRADLAICSDEADADRVQRWRKTAPTALIPIGSNIPHVNLSDDERRRLRDAARTPPAGFAVGYFGFINSSKGLDTLVRGFQRFAADHPSSRLWFIGKQFGASDATNQETADELGALLDTTGVRAQAHRTGPLEPAQISAWLQAADVCVLPYRDGWSWRRGTLLAALTQGIPVVTTRRPSVATAEPSLPELVHGRDSYLVAPDDPIGLAAGLTELADSPMLRSTLADGARETTTRFSWETIGAARREAYDALLK